MMTELAGMALATVLSGAPESNPKLGQSEKPDESSWKLLFNGKDLTGWHLRKPDGPDGWKVENGVYVNTPPSTDIQTDDEYYDFELHLEFKVSEGEGNSGVYMRDK